MSTHEYEDVCPKCDEETLVFVGDMDGMTFLRADCNCEFTDAEREEMETTLLEQLREAWLIAQAESGAE